MSLGFDAISALPFATSGPDSDVNVSVTGNQVTISIGSAGVIADSVTENLTPNQVTLGLGTLSITADANHTVTGSQVTLNVGNISVSTDVTVLPSGAPTFSFGLKYIGQSSPPRFIVVDISQLNLSLCRFNSSPFLYILA